MNDYYARVRRYDKHSFTGIPIAELRSGIWYWPDRTEAENFAKAFDLSTSFIESWEHGWIIRLTATGTPVRAPIGGTMKTAAFLIAMTVTVAADKAPTHYRPDDHSVHCTAECWYKPPFTEAQRKTFFRFGGSLVTL